MGKVEKWKSGKSENRRREAQTADEFAPCITLNSDSVRGDFPFTCRVNGIQLASLIASLIISENKWFNGVF